MHYRQRAECFAKYFPNLAEEWSEKNEDDINDFSRSSPYKAIWVCSVCGFEWEAQIVSRCTGSGGCPNCRDQKKKKETGGFLAFHPDLKLDWSDQNVIDPSAFDTHSTERVLWKCHECGCVWIAQVNSRCTGDAGCPNCRKQNSK